MFGFSFMVYIFQIIGACAAADAGHIGWGAAAVVVAIPLVLFGAVCSYAAASGNDADADVAFEVGSLACVLWPISALIAVGALVGRVVHFMVGGSDKAKVT